MGSLNLAGLPEHALLLVDSAPIIYVIEGHTKLSRLFKPVFELHDAGHVRFAATTITLVEVLTGPLSAGDEVLAGRYGATLRSWLMIDLDGAIAERAARIRATHKLKLADAVQAASALAVNADAIVTHDRDFSRLKSLRVICPD